MDLESGNVFHGRQPWNSSWCWFSRFLQFPAIISGINYLHSRSQNLLLRSRGCLSYWAGQNILLGFSGRCYGKTWTKVLATQSCPTLCDPMHDRHPGSPAHGILQARILEWVGIPFSKDLPNPGIKRKSPAFQADSLLSEPLGTGSQEWFDKTSRKSSHFRAC